MGQPAEGVLGQCGALSRVGMALELLRRGKFRFKFRSVVRSESRGWAGPASGETNSNKGGGAFAAHGRQPANGIAGAGQRANSAGWFDSKVPIKISGKHRS